MRQRNQRDHQSERTQHPQGGGDNRNRQPQQRNRRRRGRGGPPSQGYAPVQQQQGAPTQSQHPQQPVEEREVKGIVDILPKGSGFLRQIELDLLSSSDDCFLSPNVIRDFRLQPGMHVKAIAGAGARGQGPAVLRVLEINGAPFEGLSVPVPFERQVSIDPNERFVLTPTDGPEAERAMRFVELMTPLGKGQRALIVAPPRTGKTTILHQLASSIAQHHPEVFLLVLLVDERPEEVTHFKRSVRGEVIASSSDKDASAHLRVAKLTLDMARSLSESGRDVFLLLDSLTRLGRASNREEGNRGKTMSGGVSSRALEFPRRFFGSARKLESGGSLTIVATALIDTGSRMDEVIFQEFKGTGNCEIVLDRKIADSRLFPAIDLSQSGTRKEEKILPPAWLVATHKLRRHLATLKPSDALEVLLERLQKAENTDTFCNSLA